jgi:hypothetical protein
VPSRPILQGGALTANFEQIATLSPAPVTNKINLRAFYGRNKSRTNAWLPENAWTNSAGEQIAPAPNEVLTATGLIDARNETVNTTYERRPQEQVIEEGDTNDLTGDYTITVPVITTNNVQITIPVPTPFPPLPL